MEIPIVIIAYNRPKLLDSLLNSILYLKNQNIYVFVDGPKKEKLTDLIDNESINLLLQMYKKELKLKCYFREKNIGLRSNVVSAVTEILNRFESCIVLEEDCVITKEGIDFCKNILSTYSQNNEVDFVSPFNPVPYELLNLNRGFRISYFPESYAWGTWKRSWRIYENDIGKISKKLRIRQINRFTNSFVGSLIWKLNFYEAKIGLIDTWAFRWIASLWSANRKGIISNLNYVKYLGNENGTHTKISLKWNPPEIIHQKNNYNGEFRVNKCAEEYMTKVVFSGNYWYLLKRYIFFVYKFIFIKRYSIE